MDLKNDFKDYEELSEKGKEKAAILTYGEQLFVKLTGMTAGPMKAQEKLILDLIDSNKDTEFGRKYGFKDIHTIEDYQRAVPLSAYNDYEDYFIRMSENGEKNLITVNPVHHYNQSSGTTGKYKRIPFSDVDIKKASIYNSLLCNYFIAKKLGRLKWFENRMFSSLQAVDKMEHMPDGSTFCYFSALLYEQNRPYIETMGTSPAEAVFAKPGTDAKYLHARFALANTDIFAVTCTFYSHLLDMFRYIEANWEMLVDDIEAGTINPVIKMDDDVRASVLQKIKPLPERAGELRAVFSQGFDEPFAKKIWKDLVATVGVGTADFEYSYNLIMDKYLGRDILTYFSGIEASEGVFALPLELDNPNAVCIPDLCFLEFIPFNSEDDEDFENIVTMDKLEVGKEYELVITNSSGLYRYRMKDVVRCTGMYNKTPTLMFEHRVDQTLSITGEKTTISTLRDVADNTAKKLDFELVDFSVYPDTEAVPARYIYMMEIGDNPSNADADAICEQLNIQLRTLHPLVKELQTIGVFGDVVLKLLKPDTYITYKEMKIRGGTPAAQIKPVRVIKTDEQKKYFFEHVID